MIAVINIQVNTNEPVINLTINYKMGTSGQQLL